MWAFLTIEVILCIKCIKVSLIAHTVLLLFTVGRIGFTRTVLCVYAVLAFVEAVA